MNWSGCDTVVSADLATQFDDAGSRLSLRSVEHRPAVGHRLAAGTDERIQPLGSQGDELSRVLLTGQRPAASLNSPPSVWNRPAGGVAVKADSPLLPFLSNECALSQAAVEHRMEESGVRQRLSQAQPDFNAVRDVDP